MSRETWEQIVLNLLSNALKFTFEGAIDLTLRPRPDGSAVELAVRDTGTGIPEDELPRLLSGSHRVQGARARTHEGTGIGLALVSELVKLHGGTVTAESEEGRGTAFTICLPLGAAHLPADRVNADQSLTSAASRSTAFVEEAPLDVQQRHQQRPASRVSDSGQRRTGPSAPASARTGAPGS